VATGTRIPFLTALLTAAAACACPFFLGLKLEHIQQNLALGSLPVIS
jgi:hypothetical protein